MAHNTSEIVCPHCGYEFSESYEISPNEEDIGKIQCEQCEKFFYATRNVEITYDTEKCRVGTCRKCGKKNVVLENMCAYGNSKVQVDDYCEECLKTARRAIYGNVDVIDIKGVSH